MGGNGQVDSNGDNIYMIDTSVPRRLPPPPAFYFSSDQDNEKTEKSDYADPATEDDVGFKFYETYERVSLHKPERESRSGSQYSNECQLSPTYLTLEERCVVPDEEHDDDNDNDEEKEVESDSSESFYSEIIA